MLTIDDDTKAACERTADRLLRDIKGARAVIVTTGDGLPLACRVGPEDDPARLAAVAGSLAALGDLGSTEARLGTCRHVCIEADGGHVVLCQARSERLDVVVCVSGGTGSALGQMLYTTRQHASRLATLLQATEAVAS
ncbi:MAG: roadblock/LC7 domain-containing protein [Luteibacter sp.]